MKRFRIVLFSIGLVLGDMSRCEISNDNDSDDVQIVLNHTTLLEQLFTIGSIELRDCVLHDGSFSPVFIDMRSIISYPPVLHHVIHAMWNKIDHLNFDLICGVSYASFLLTIGLALNYKQPMIISHTGQHNQNIIGSYALSNRVLLVEDVLASGESCIDTIKMLAEQGLEVQHVITFIDRDMGARERLAALGVEVHAVFTLPVLLNSIPCKAPQE